MEERLLGSRRPADRDAAGDSAYRSEKASRSLCRFLASPRLLSLRRPADAGTGLEIDTPAAIVTGLLGNRGVANEREVVVVSRSRNFSLS